MFKIVLRDSSLYPKQLSLFCLLWLISVSADRIDSITKFCLWHDITVGPAQKTAVINIEGSSLSWEKEN